MTDKCATGDTDPCPLPSAVKAKYEWYQTEQDVVVAVLLKNIRSENVRVDYHETSVSITIKLESGSDYSLELDLAHPVVPDKSSFKVSASRVEVKLRKAHGHRWKDLEGNGSVPVIKQSGGIVGDAAKVPSYPTSSHSGPKNWDKMVADVKKEESEEKLEGDQAVNQLFQKIYGDSNDEVKKAMIKSYQESGGTVLSTNWDEVKKEKVECKPPDGMEWKKY